MRPSVRWVPTALFLAFLLSLVGPAPVQATAAGTVSPVTGPGFDTCSAPPDSTMNTWWQHSPYYSVGIYIGGVHRKCSQPNLKTNWATYNSISGIGHWGS